MASKLEFATRLIKSIAIFGKGKIIHKKIRLNPRVLLTENRGDIRYMVDFLKEVVENGVDPKKTMFYQFAGDIDKNIYYNPGKMANEFIALYEEIRKDGISSRTPVVKCDGQFVKTRWFFCGSSFIKYIKNNTGYQIYDDANHTIYDDNMLRYVIPCPKSSRQAAYELAIAIYLKHESIPCALVEFGNNYYYSPNFTEFIKKKEETYRLFLSNDKLRNFHQELNAIHMSHPRLKSDGSHDTFFYQTFKELEINGSRNTEARFRKYGLDKLLSNKCDVLDIGSNVGFFSLYCSKHVNSIDSIDPNKSCVEVSNHTRNFLGITNCTFYQTSFEEFKTKKKYDFIFSFAVHRYMKLSFEGYLEALHELLKEGGQLLLESHTIERYDSSRFTNSISTLYSEENIYFAKGVTDSVKRGLFKIVNQGFTYDYGVNIRNRRMFYLLKKT
jgi:2-polyprenyl-3-methyl-5-hydroxy-6-metoxy-1,4-benzoquinol methylase